MPASPSEILRRWFARVWNAGDESAIDEIYTPDTVAHGLPGGPIKGPAAFKPFFHSFRSAFPNIRVEVTHSVTEGELCAVHCDVTGTHTGDGLGVPATNRSVHFTGMTMARVGSDGRILEGWNSYDFLLMYHQLGIDPPQPV
jgi:steroid delta-isomerase-like uncharacterized protein